MGKNKRNDDGLTKAERKALEQREAALMAELEARAAASKHKKVKADDTPDVTTMKRKALKSLARDDEAPKAWRKAARKELERRDDEPRELESDEPVKPKKSKGEGDKPVKPARPEKSAKAKTVEAAEGVLAGVSTDAAREAAETALEAASEASDDETDDEIKARVRAKREARAAAAVKGASGKPVANDVPGSARMPDAIGDESEVEYQHRKAAEKGGATAPSKTNPPKAKGKKAAADPAIEYATAVAEELGQVAEVVETEKGREFAVGTPAADETFGKPSEAPAVDFETNGNGQYKVKRPSDGKIVGYTRVTTFIGTNEDRTLLEAWKMRILLEGVGINDSPDESGRIDEPVVAKVRDLMHVRDVAIAKARKDDRKGKLAPGQYGTIVDGAWSAFKRDLDALAESLLELGGAHEKAAKGTQLHELFEVHDREGMDAIDAMAVAGTITSADLADVEAYARAIEAAGIKIIPEYIEAPVVIHDEKIAGRLDRVVMARMPGAARAAKYVLDVKSGRIDLGAGKIAQQLEKYSKGTPYDLDTHETLAPHGASRTKALVLHLVPGSAKASIHPVDLSLGRVGNDLSAKVRTFRNDGKRSIDLTVDLADPKAAS